MNPILNRAADGWYHVVPLGEYKHNTGGVQVLDAKAAESIVNRFNQDSRAENFPGLLVDQDHFSYDDSKSSEAYGWIKKLEKRNDGVWGQIAWSGKGEEVVKNGGYRFLSPVWLPGEVEQLGEKKIRPLRLDTAGLTNNPNLRGMVPLSNRAERAVPLETLESEITRLQDVFGFSIQDTTRALRKLKPHLFSTATNAGVDTSAQRLANRARAVEKQADEKRQANRVTAAVKDYQATHGTPFAVSWDATRRERPELFGVQPLTNRSATGSSGTGEAERSRTRNALVGLRMLTNRCSFSAGWDHMSKRQPELFSNGPTPFLNRQAADLLDWIDDDSKQAVAEHEKTVKSVADLMISGYGGRVISSALGTQLPQLVDRIKGLMTDDSLSFDAAWEKLRHDDPIGFSSRIIQAGRQMENFKPVNLTEVKQHGPRMTGVDGWAN